MVHYYPRTRNGGSLGGLGKLKDPTVRVVWLYIIHLWDLLYSRPKQKKVIFRPPCHSKLAIFRRGQKRVSDTNFFGLSIQFPHQLGPNDGKSSGPRRYLTFNTFWATLVYGVADFTAIFHHNGKLDGAEILSA